MKLEHRREVGLWQLQGLWLAVLLMLVSWTAQAVDIVEVSAVTNSQNQFSHPGMDNVWKVTAPPYPFNTSSGIGWIVNPALTGNNDFTDFAMHVNPAFQPAPVYASPYVPNATNATITYKFDSPLVVGGMEIVQHANGVTKIEGLLGNSEGALTSLGAVFGPSGDVQDVAVSADTATQKFFFGNTNVAGSIFKMVVRKTANASAFALYRAYPLDVNGHRIPPALQAPILMSIKLSQVQISWNAIKGKLYQVQYYTATNFNQWSNLNSTVTATTNTAFTSDSILNQSNRVYRILQLP